ncbi:hypothetical protein ABIA52_003967 [Paenarthrobacter histidinolovorans]|uniref:NADPH-dependent FMN reductase-like domain-containing protein n=1 Tax=Paenarthrobacter histidinolovorans TaxID=43664 RepID=A0ABW8NC65_9MICC
MDTFKIGYFVGSLASNSINRVLSKALISVAPPELEFHEIAIKDLPLYSSDYDADFPPAGRELKDAIAASGRDPVHLPRIQPFHPWRPEERHRLGLAPLGHQLVRTETHRNHRRFARWHRHRSDAVLHAQRFELPGRAAAERA